MPVGSRVTSLCRGGGSWLLAGTAAGDLLRGSFGAGGPLGVAPAPRPPPAVSVRASAHGGPLIGALFSSPAAPDVVVAASADGDIRLWSASSARCTHRCALALPHAPVTVVWADAGAAAAGTQHVFCGLADGMLRSVEVAAGGAGRSPETWVQLAHRGAVTAITGNASVVVTGGADGR